MEHQLHYSERYQNWAWASFPMNKMCDTIVMYMSNEHGRYTLDYVPYRPWLEFQGTLAWWEAAQLFGGGN